MAAWLTVIIAWLVIFILVSSIGQSLRLVLHLSDYSLLGWLDSFWIGYAALIAVLQLIHLVTPIDWHITLALGIFGLIAVALCFVRRPDPSALGTATLNLLSLFLLLLIPLIVWLSNRALSPQLDFDSGFYHLSAIKWLNEYPIVPGLANLHYRLGFNQTTFLFDALLNAYPYFDHGFTFANSLFMLILLAQLLWITIRAIFVSKSAMLPVPYSLLSMFLLPITFYRALPQRFSANISSPSPDLSVFIFQILVMLMLVRYLFDTDVSRNHRNRFYILYIFTLCIVGITSKLSFAAFGGAIMLIVFLHYLWLHRPNWQPAALWLTRWIVVLALALGAVWIVRTSLLTGYPLFPNRAAALSVDFRVPTSIAREAELWVYAFARNPLGDMDQTLSNWNWLSGWWGRMSDSFNQYLFVIPLYASLVMLAIVLLMTPFTLIRFRRVDWRYLLPVLPAALACLAWFFSAPDPRFAGAAFWVLAASLALCLSAYLATPFRLRLVALASLLITSYLFIATVSVDFTFRADFPTIPQTPLQEFHTDSGLVYNRSASTQNPLNLYNAPLPNSPYAHPRLELRGIGLRDGFRLPDQ